MLKLLLSAYVAQRLLGKAPGHVLFASVFVIVYISDNVHRFLPSERGSPIFLEEAVAGLLVYAALGLVAWWLDAQMAVYTGRHAGPVIPGTLVALLDRAWPSPGLSGRRR